MADFADSRFLVNFIIGSVILFFPSLRVLQDTFVTPRQEPGIKMTRKIRRIRMQIIIFFWLGVGLMTLGGFWLCYPMHRAMDLPNILSYNYKSTEGVVMKYSYDQGGMTGGNLSIEDEEGKRYHFREINTPFFLEKGDWVQVAYWENSRIGVITEINGVEYGKLPSVHGYVVIALFLIIFLLLAMPFYAFRIFKWIPFFNREADYSICVYRDLLVRGIFILWIIMMLSAEILVVAILGKYTGFLDWYWKLLVCADYLGTAILAFFSGKVFVLTDSEYRY